MRKNKKLVMTKDFETDAMAYNGSGQLGTFVTYMVKNSQLLPYWWSESREAYLRKASLEVDIISSIINNLTMRLFNMPLQVVPDNHLISSHASVAKYYQAMINNAWARHGELFINDLLTFDKGAFLVIESTSSPSRPLSATDLPTGLKYIPSQQIMLNDNEEFPYIHQRSNGTNVYLHETRVIRLTQMPISLRDNVFVGLSFASRAFNVGQLLNSAINYGLESLGTLSSDNIIYATSTTSKAIQQAFKDANIDSANAGNSNKGQNVYIGLRDPAGKVGQIELKKLPASFDYEKFTNVTVKLLAIAAGVDENDIIAVSGAGTTKSATLVSELKAKFKLESWFTKRLQQEMQAKFLPSFLKLQVGEKSDNISETEGKARINLVRSDKLLAEFGALDDRTARQNAVKYGLIIPTQFEEMELIDGRLANGLPVSSLFYTQNEMLQSMLNIGIDVTNLVPEDAEKNIPIVRAKIAEVLKIAVNTSSQNIFASTKQALAALEWVISKYEEEQAKQLAAEIAAEERNEPDEDVKSPGEESNNNMDKRISPTSKLKANANKPADTTKPNETLAKSYYRPKTVKGREKQKALRSKVRSVWSSNDEKLMTSAEELKSSIDSGLDIDEQVLIEFARYVNLNRQDNGTKLNDLYALLDEIMEDYDFSYD